MKFQILNEKSIIKNSLIIVFSLIVSLFIVPDSVYADSSNCVNNLDSEACILHKTVLENIYQCYQRGGVNNKVENFTGYSNIFTDRPTLALPPTYVDTKLILRDTNELNCKDLSLGMNQYSGIRNSNFSYNGKKLDVDNVGKYDNVDDRKTLMEGLGYKAIEQNNSGKQCISIKADVIEPYMDPIKVSSPTYCMKTDAQGIIEGQPKINSNESSIYEYINVTVDPTDFTVNIPKFSPKISIPIRYQSLSVSELVDSLEANIKTDFDDASQEYEDAEGKNIGNAIIVGEGRDGTIYLQKIEVSVSSESQLGLSYELDINNLSASGMRAIYSLSGEPDGEKNDNELAEYYAKLKFSDNQKIALYESYLLSKDLYNASEGSKGTVVIPKQEQIGSYLNRSDYTPTAWRDKTGTYSCAFLKLTDPNTAKVWGIDDNGHYDGMNKINASQLIAELDDMLGEDGSNTCAELKQVVGTETTGIEPGNAPNEQGGMGTPTEEPVSAHECQVNLTLGWILCPILKGVTNALGSIYNNVIEPFLEFNPGILQNGDAETPTHIAWTIFQNTANIGLILVLLFVIFSQITGIGIDNYGIKKILPKLIVGAVLINLSFFICQFLVDLSNILGNTLQNTFNGLGVELLDDGYYHLSAEIKMTPGEMASRIWTSVGATFADFAGLGLIGVCLYLILSNPITLQTVVPAVVLAIVSALVSIFFTFILLGARQAGVVIFVAIAPLAFLCYILPNTKNLFKKWLDIFKALLLAYPIIGLMMGGGTFVGKLILLSNPNDFWFGLMGMLIQIIPFFFIPTVLRSSMKGIGNIGARISQVGKRFGRWSGGLAKTGVRNSATMRAAAERAGRARAGRISGRLNARRDSKMEEILRRDYGGKSYEDLTAEEQAEVQRKATDALGLRRAIRLNDANMAMAGQRKVEEERYRNTSSNFLESNRVQEEAATAGTIQRTDAMADAGQKHIDAEAVRAKADARGKNKDEAFFIDHVDEKKYLNATGNRAEVGSEMQLGATMQYDSDDFVRGMLSDNKTRLDQQFKDVTLNNRRFYVVEEPVMDYERDEKTGEIIREGRRRKTPRMVPKKDANENVITRAVTFAEDENGDFVGVDLKGHTIKYSAQEISQRVSAGDGKFTNYAETRGREQNAMREGRLGQVSAFADEKTTEEVGASQLSSNLASSFQRSEDMKSEGSNDNVYTHFHEAANRRIDTEGRSESFHSINEHGDASGALDHQQGVARKWASAGQYMEAARNNINLGGTPTYGKARDIVTQQENVREAREFADAIVNLTNADLAVNLETELTNSRNPALFGEVMRRLETKNGFQNEFTTIFNMANSQNLGRQQAEALAQSSNAALREWGKINSQLLDSGGTAISFKTFMTDRTPGGNNFYTKINAKSGENAVKLSDDDLKALQNAGLDNTLEDVVVAKGLIGNPSDKSRTEFTKILRNRTSSYRDIDNILRNIGNDQFAKIDAKTLDSIFTASDISALKADTTSFVGNFIVKAQADNELYNSISGNVRSKLGI